MIAPRQYQDWRARRVPPVEQVAEGLWSLPVPMPGSGLRYVLVYLLELPDGAALVDCGWPGEEAWRELAAGLAEAGYRPRDVRAVLATHIHTDHYGLAGRLRQGGAWIGLHPADAALGIAQGASDDARRAAWHGQQRRLGMPLPEGDGVPGSRQPPRWRRAYQVRPDILLNDNDVLDLPGWRVRVIWTPGHSPGHLCFLEENLGILFGGDHVLPKVTPHVSAGPGRPPNPLEDYLSSLAMIAEVDAGAVLPAHEYRYAGLRERAGELTAHHTARLAEIEEVLWARPGATCWELTQRLSWSRPLDSQPASLRRTAGSETLAHLLLLAGRDRAHPDGDEPQRWHPGAAP